MLKSALMLACGLVQQQSRMVRPLIQRSFSTAAVMRQEAKDSNPYKATVVWRMSQGRNESFEDWRLRCAQVEKMIATIARDAKLVSSCMQYGIHTRKCLSVGVQYSIEQVWESKEDFIKHRPERSQLTRIMLQLHNISVIESFGTQVSPDKIPTR